jgi:hypothetical protein
MLESDVAFVVQWAVENFRATCNILALDRGKTVHQLFIKVVWRVPKKHFASVALGFSSAAICQTRSENFSWVADKRNSLGNIPQTGSAVS